MKRLMVIGLAVGFILGQSGLAMAGNTAWQTVTFKIQAINEIEIVGTSASLSYNITTNETSKKIIARIDTDMSANITLKINVIAPPGGTSVGWVSLSRCCNRRKSGNRI